MICAKCKRPIERSYGRVTDMGNYCRECAIQNELESRKSIAEYYKKHTPKEGQLSDFLAHIKEIYNAEEGDE